MRTLWFGAAVLVVALGVVACGQPSHEDMIQEMISTMDGVADVLDDVTDKASAEAAVPKIEGYLADIEDLAETAKDMEDPPKEEQEALMKKYLGELMKSGERFGSAMRKALENPEAAEVLKPLLEKLQSKMNKMN